MNKGFSLIEVAIIIIIMALSLGAAMSSYYLMQSARLRSVVVDVNAHINAVTNFKKRYNQLPGDISNATDYWNDGVYNGDGNGKIELSMDRSKMEGVQAWRHLSLSNEVSGDYIGTFTTIEESIGKTYAPSSIIGGGYNIWYREELLHGTLLKGNTISFASIDLNIPALVAPIIKPLEAQAIDKKVDDGLAASGRVRGENGFFWPALVITCINEKAVPNEYDISIDERSCKLTFIIGQ